MRGEIKSWVSGVLFPAGRLVGLALDSRLNGSAPHKSFLTLIVWATLPLTKISLSENFAGQFRFALRAYLRWDFVITVLHGETSFRLHNFPHVSFEWKFNYILL